MSKSNEKELLEIIYSYRKAQLIHVAAKLGISDLLESGTQNNETLAKLTGTNPDALYRVLRALSSFGIYAEMSDKRFKLTPKAELLKEHSRSALRIDAIMRMEEYNWMPWGELLYSVKTGKSAFEKIFGKNLFAYLADKPEASRTFSQAMSIYSHVNAHAILNTYDFLPYSTVADIGGAHGEFLKMLLTKYQHLKGILFDLSHVVADVDWIRKSVFVDRIRVVGGDFFTSVPENCDLYILKKVIHDWDDINAGKILSNCYHASRKGSKILLAEKVISDTTENSTEILLADIHMLVQTIEGRERTSDEYSNLLVNAGFCPTGIGNNYVEGTKL